MIESVLALLLVAAAASGAAIRTVRLVTRRRGGCAGCPKARP
jgi:hypothetical protein